MGECFDSPWWSSRLACNTGLLQSVHFITLSSNESASCRLSRFESLSNLGESASGSNWVSGVAPLNAVHVSCGQSMDRVRESEREMRMSVYDWDEIVKIPNHLPQLLYWYWVVVSVSYYSPLVLSEWRGLRDETRFGELASLFPCLTYLVYRATLLRIRSGSTCCTYPLSSRSNSPPLLSSLPPRLSFTFPFESSTSN